jgi:nitroreductase
MIAETVVHERNAMDLFTAIESRTTAGRLAAPGPTAEHLARMIAAATRAPDHGRLRPWRFFVLDHVEREKFADAVVEGRRKRLPSPTPEQLTAERNKVWRSPTLLVVGCAVHVGHPKVPEIEQVLAVGAAVENLLLAAQALGYGAMWKTGPAAYDPGVKAALGLEPVDHIVAIVHLGTPVVPLVAPEPAKPPPPDR